MTDYSIVKASVRHVKPMALNMRPAGYFAMQHYGGDPRRAVFQAFRQSFYCRVALIDDKPVAMWGVAGTLLNDRAEVWLVLSHEIGNMPLAIVREARTELNKVTEDYSYLEATILPEDAASIRFAQFLGFSAGEEDRIPIGDSYVLRMSYQPERAH